MTDRATANRYLQETYLPAYNAEFTQPPREPGSAFVECRGRGILDDGLCEPFERTVRKDNGVPFEGLTEANPRGPSGPRSDREDKALSRRPRLIQSVPHSFRF